jgi:FdhD protein
MITTNRPALQWRDPTDQGASDEVRENDECVAVEATLVIVVNGDELVRLSSSPTHCVDLALGFLITEGVISSLADVTRTDHEPGSGLVTVTIAPERPFIAAEWRKSQTITSGCGAGVTLSRDLPRIDRTATPELKLSPQYFLRFFSILRTDYSLWYDRTGCIHQAALATVSGPPVIREDIGRHNAVDKAIGAAMQLNLSPASAVLCCTGRLSSEMVRKAARVGISVVASRTAPTSLAVDLAEQTGMTLLGFVRGRRINVYTHPERIVFDEIAEHVRTDQS